MMSADIVLKMFLIYKMSVLGIKRTKITLYFGKNAQL